MGVVRAVDSVYEVDETQSAAMAASPGTQPLAGEKSYGGRWTSAERERLVNAVESSPRPIDWEGIAKHFPGRTDCGCRSQWYGHPLKIHADGRPPTFPPRASAHGPDEE